MTIIIIIATFIRSIFVMVNFDYEADYFYLY